MKATAIGMSSPWVNVNGLGPLEDAKLSTGDIAPRPVEDNEDQLSDDFNVFEEPIFRNYRKFSHNIKHDR